MNRIARIACSAGAGAIGMALAAPASAQEYYYEDDGAYEASAEGYYDDDTTTAYDPTYADPYAARGYSQAERTAWLDECRRRVTRDGNGALVGGLVGGVVGGVVGNRVAGRGDRVVGTIAGAAVGGVAGAAVGSAIDDGNARDECEAYLLDYEANWQAQQGYYAQGYYQHGQVVGYTYGVPMMIVRVPVGRRHHRHDEHCTETVEEYVTYETVYEEAPARRHIPARRETKTQPVKTYRYAK